MQATQRRHASLLVTALAAASTVQDAVSTKIVLRQCELAFGESVRVVGDTDKLGNWSHDNGPELQWREGHNWEADLELFPGTSSFKVICHSHQLSHYRCLHACMLAELCLSDWQP